MADMADNPVTVLADAWSEKRGLERGSAEWQAAREMWLDGYEAGWAVGYRVVKDIVFGEKTNG